MAMAYSNKTTEKYHPRAANLLMTISFAVYFPRFNLDKCTRFPPPAKISRISMSGSADSAHVVATAHRPERLDKAMGKTSN